MAEKIIVFHAGGIGDLVLSLPALKAIREAHSGCELKIVGYPSRLRLLEKRFYADAIGSIDSGHLAALFTSEPDLDELRVKYFSDFDFAISFMRDRSGAFELNLKKLFRGRALAFNLMPPPGSGFHMVDYLLGELRKAGIRSNDGRPRLFTNEEDRLFAGRFYAERGIFPGSGSKILTIHPGSGSKEKCAPPGLFARAADYFASAHGAKVAMVVGPADEERASEAVAMMKYAVPLGLRGFELEKLAALLEASSCFLGNDSGISHMAAALGIPTVVIFGPTDSTVWGPRGEKVKIIRCESYGRLRSLVEISPLQVIDAIERFR